MVAWCPHDAPHQGVVIEVEPLEDAWLDELIGRPDESAILLVLDQVTDPHNVGAILRSAAAFGAIGIVTQDRHSPPESGVVAKAASGALERVPWTRVVNLARALEEIGEAGFWRIGLAGDADTDSRTRLVQSVSLWCLAPKGRAFGPTRASIATRWRAFRSATRSRASMSRTPPRSRSMRRASPDGPHPREASATMSRRSQPRAGLRARGRKARNPRAANSERGAQTLLRTIVGQQVSVAAARSMWAKLEARLRLAARPSAAARRKRRGAARCGHVAPETGYIRSLAELVISGELDLANLPGDDEEAIALLTKIKGIGRWSAEIYLLFAEGRADVFPAGDLAVMVELGRLMGLDDKPSEKQLREIAEALAAVPRRGRDPRLAQL